MVGGVNVIVPMAGMGKRFIDEGYRFPKPLINVVGRPMLLWLFDHLCVSECDTVFLAMNHCVASDFKITELVQKEFPGITFKTVSLYFQTRGAAETLYAVVQHMDEAELSRPTISLDCDTIYFSDVLTIFRSLPVGVGITYYFEDHGNVPQFSYIETSSDDHVIRMAEKEKISTKANTGAYGFPSAHLLKEVLLEVFRSGLPLIGEFYTSSVMQRVIDRGVSVQAAFVEDFACVGTKVQLQAFLKKLQAKPSQSKPRRFCFDLDNTLVTFPSIPGDYTSVTPIQANVNIAQRLKSMGHIIIIYTARRMKTYGGNVGRVIQDIGSITMDTLRKYDIPCDELYFGKPHADLYIDDLAVHSLLDTEKEVGLAAEEDDNEPKEFISCRPHNSILLLKDIVLKSSEDVDSLLAEKYAYEHIPGNIKDLFPKLKGISLDPCGKLCAIRLEKIEGYPLSKVLITRCLSRWHIEELLKSLKRVHTSDVAGQEPAADHMYLNYAAKLEKRFKKFSRLYAQLNMTEEFQKKLMQALECYEKEQKGMYVSFIHGDPVLTNVLMNHCGCFKFIDMRGQLGSKLHTGGDLKYDLAKVFQSFLGYDFILLDKPLDESDHKYLETIREIFLQVIGQHYPKVNVEDLYLLASSLLVSLIPLHEEKTKQLHYLSLGRAAFSQYERASAHTHTS